MKTKFYYLIFAFFLVNTAFAQKELAQKYDRATFTVVPFITYIKDTIKADTNVSTWAKLPKSSILRTDIKPNLIQSDLLTTNKFYYNHTTVSTFKNFIVQKQDSSLFFNLYSLTQPAKTPEKQSPLFKTNPDSREEIEEFETVSDNYADWIKSNLEKSTIPGEMLFTWTNPEILRIRAMENLINIEKDRKVDTDNYEYYKKLFAKNYIVVQHTVHTTKFAKKIKDTDTSKKSGKIQETKSLANSIKGISKFTKDIAISSKTDDKNKSVEKIATTKLNQASGIKSETDKTNVEIDNGLFTKSYVFKIILDENTLAQLSQFPPKQPQDVKLEFVGRVFSKNKSLSEFTESSGGEFSSSSDDKIEFGGNVEKNRKKSFYEKSKKETMILFETGEYLCAKKAFAQLLLIDNSEKKTLDSLALICDIEIKKSPKINMVSFKNASKIQQNQINDFAYNTACPNYEYLGGSKEFKDTQGAFNYMIETLERNLIDFKVISTISEIKGNKIKSKIDVSQGIYLDQQYKIVERTLNKKGEKYDRTVGTAKIIGVSKDFTKKINDSTFSLSTFAQVDGGKVESNMFLVQNDNKGKTLNAGIGYRYNYGAIIVGYETRIGKLLKRQMPFSGLTVGLNAIVNMALVSRSEGGGWYTPKYLDLAFSRELYFHKKFDIKPYIGIGYGGDTKKGATDRFFLGTAGVALPININGRFSKKRKIKIMPDVSYTLGFKPQFSLQTKIDY